MKDTPFYAEMEQQIREASNDELVHYRDLSLIAWQYDVVNMVDDESLRRGLITSIARQQLLDELNQEARGYWIGTPRI